MTTQPCSCGQLPTGLSYLGEPLCRKCVEAERTDGTPEATVEQFARDFGLSPSLNHFVRLNGVMYEVSPFCTGRDWHAVEVEDAGDAEVIEYRSVTT